MPRSDRATGGGLWWAWLTICLCPLPVAWGQTNDSPATWQSRLDAGEYAIALREIRQLPTSAERDQALATVAAHQASRGAAEAATRTVLEIRSDLLQFQTLNQFRPFVGGNVPVLGGNGPFAGNGFNNGFGNALNGVGNPFGPGMVDGAGNTGGGVQADFDTLIELITRTVSPESWEDVGGAGTIAEFPTGVLIDAAGWMREIPAGELASRAVAPLPSDPELIHISLPRLEAALLAQRALGLPPSDSMRRLDGLAKIDYVLVDPSAHDVLLVGPRATDAAATSAGRLSDLCVALQNAWQGDGRMVCSITPRQQNLAATQAFLTVSAATPLKPGRRREWLNQLRDKLGRQDIEFSGVPTDSHTAQVLVAADYHMKLVGMGLRPAVAGVESYLDTVEPDADGTLPAMDVLRWWFTLSAEPVITNSARTAFRLPTAAVRVQSENEMLADRGIRVHTGASEPLNRRFATSFSEHFSELEATYPIYHDLHAIFDLAIVAAVLRDEAVLERIEWQPTLLASLDPYVVPRYQTPREVESVINHRLLNKTTIIAGISGGVDLAPRRDLERPRIRPGEYDLDRVGQEGRPREDRHASSKATVHWHW